MANVDGSWNTVVKSPLGDQNLTLTVQSDGGSFSGEASGAMAAVPLVAMACAGITDVPTFGEWFG